MLKRLLIFLVINFAGLAIGGLFTNDGVVSEWYNNLNKAPWTPPGWVFGAAWTTIMICFAIYMAVAWVKVANLKTLAYLFGLQWVLNVLWNPAFFYLHKPLLGLLIIGTLTILIGVFLFKYRNTMKNYSLLVLPYFLWLLIATSLNAYILFNN